MFLEALSVSGLARGARAASAQEAPRERRAGPRLLQLCLNPDKLAASSAQVLRVGRAAKIAALKLRVSRAGRALLGLAGSSGKPRSSGKLSELGDRQEPADPRKCSSRLFRL